jgi:uncharacterized protein (TIGR02246 family)
MDMTGIRQAIEAANDKFGEAVRKGDGAALAALYADDARLLPPNGEMLQGTTDIKAFWTGALQMGIRDANLTTLEVIGMGELACEIGKYDLTIKPEGQGTIEDMGKYVVMWKRSSNGAWKLYVDIWNTSKPA